MNTSIFLMKSAKILVPTTYTRTLITSNLMAYVSNELFLSYNFKSIHTQTNTGTIGTVVRLG